MAPRLSPEDVRRLADLAGVSIPEEDLEHLASSLGAHAEAVAPLLEADLEDVPPALVLDPRWRG